MSSIQIRRIKFTKMIDHSILKQTLTQQDTIGGLEIAGMAGAMLAAASHRVPILGDGFIASIAALIANGLAEGAVHYMFVGHKSAEPGHQTALALLGKEPIVDLGLRLGEGTGAAVAFPILKAATHMLAEMATFESAGVSTKQ